MSRGVLLDTVETIAVIRGRAKDDDSCSGPFHEMKWFSTLEEAMTWAKEAKKKGYPFVCVDVTIDVKKIYKGMTSSTLRWEQPYLYNANIASDAQYYEKLKGFGQFVDDDWVVIRHGKLLCCVKSEEEALKVASRVDGRCLIRHAWHETENDDCRVNPEGKRYSR